MLKQHEFYVYHSENRVMARMGDQEPVVAKTCKTAQEAHDEVQAIINPQKKLPSDFGKDSIGRDMGFHHPDFQNAISGNCEAFVKAAYAAAQS